MSANGAGAPAPAPLAIAGPTTPAGRRGRGHASPAVNPRVVTDFEDVTSIPFAFARHPICHEAHVHMSAICSDAFMDMGDLFAATAPPSRTAFAADPVVIVKNKIRDDFVVPNAVDTPDPARVAPLWARCSFSISAGHRCTNRRLTPATLREAVQHAIAHNLTHELKIAIGMQALHFQPGLSCSSLCTEPVLRKHACSCVVVGNDSLSLSSVVSSVIVISTDDGGDHCH